jgi:hypothetical protein
VKTGKPKSSARTRGTRFATILIVKELTGLDEMTAFPDMQKHSHLRVENTALC